MQRAGLRPVRPGADAALGGSARSRRLHAPPLLAMVLVQGRDEEDVVDDERSVGRGPGDDATDPAGAHAAGVGG
jgi:hypothetical protein